MQSHPNHVVQQCIRLGCDDVDYAVVTIIHGRAQANAIIVIDARVVKTL